MIIYIPQEIASVEDAKSLPEGSVVFLIADNDVFSGTKLGVSYWRTNTYSRYASDFTDRDVVGWTYLKPVDVVDSLVSLVAENSEFSAIYDVRRRLKEGRQ